MSFWRRVAHRLVRPAIKLDRNWVLASTILTAVMISAFASNRLIQARIPTDFEENYYPAALNIQHGNGYVNSEGRLITHWPPGFSLFLSLWVNDDITRSINTIRFVTMGLVALWIVLLERIIAKITPSVALAPVLISAVFWPPMLALPNPMLSEMLFTVCLTGGICILIYILDFKDRGVLQLVLCSAGAGLLLGGAIVTRTMGLALSLGIILALVLSFRSLNLRSRSLITLMVGCGLAIPVAGWAYHYKDKTGRLGLTSAGMPAVKYDFGRFRDSIAGSHLRDLSRQWDSIDDVVNDLDDVFSRYPYQTAVLLATKVARVWYATDSRKLEGLLMVVQLPWAILFVWSIYRSLSFWKRIPVEVIMLQGVVVSTWAASAISLSLVRYLLPVFPFVVVAVFWHISDLVDSQRRDRGQPSGSFGLTKGQNPVGPSD